MVAVSLVCDACICHKTNRWHLVLWRIESTPCIDCKTSQLGYTRMGWIVSFIVRHPISLLRPTSSLCRWDGATAYEQMRSRPADVICVKPHFPINLRARAVSPKNDETGYLKPMFSASLEHYWHKRDSVQRIMWYFHLTSTIPVAIPRSLYVIGYFKSGNQLCINEDLHNPPHLTESFGLNKISQQRSKFQVRNLSKLLSSSCVVT